MLERLIRDRVYEGETGDVEEVAELTTALVDELHIVSRPRREHIAACLDEIAMDKDWYDRLDEIIPDLLPVLAEAEHRGATRALQTRNDHLLDQIARLEEEVRSLRSRVA